MSGDANAAAVPEPGPETWTTVEAFYRRECVLLQAGRYREWVALFAPDVRYRAPVVRVADTREGMVAREDELAYYDDDHETLTLRAEKMSLTLSWTEFPPSRVRYFIQPLDIVALAAAEVQVTSNFLAYQTRLDHREHLFFGERTDVMRLDGPSPLVARRRIVLDRSRLASENVSLFF